MNEENSFQNFPLSLEGAVINRKKGKKRGDGTNESEVRQKLLEASTLFFQTRFLHSIKREREENAVPLNSFCSRCVLRNVLSLRSFEKILR